MIKEIFVFGSNTEGRHGKGAALEAMRKHGAVYRQSRGRQGNSYAIVTKDLRRGVRSIPLEKIGYEVEIFLYYAKQHPELIFNVTPIGCGLAGYMPEEIAPMFKDYPDNVRLPEIFLKALKITNKL